MAEIELVIRISEEDFEIMKHNIAVNNPLCPLSQEEMVSKVAKGIPLSKGHGRLKDINEIEALLELNKDDNGLADIAKALKNIIESVPTMIEANKEEEE